MQSRSLFHVHTYRCGHAENVPDQTYIDRAIELGASDIWFSDHAPFPGDYFGSRMKYAELQLLTCGKAHLFRDGMKARFYNFYPV